MLNKMINHLLELGTEGAYWDFKQEWHSNNVDLLHDIICMANNLEDCDAYIIIGVTDNGDVCGVPETNRKNQQNVIDFLKDKAFAGSVRPTVYVQCLDIDNKSVDVIIVKNTMNTPYYLEKEYDGLHKGNIYTRIVDTNTPKNNNADIDKVEWLWKKRFGLVGNFEHRLKRILLSDSWVCEDAGEWQEHFFNEFYPEIRVDVNNNETLRQKNICTAHDCFYYLYDNAMFWNGHGSEKLTRKCYDTHWAGNRIHQFFTISAPKMYFDFVEPKVTFLSTDLGILLKNSNGSGLGAAYAYFTEDSIRYLLLQMITPLQDRDVINSKYGDNGIFCSNVVPLFTDENEHSEFMNYVSDKKERFMLDYNGISVGRGMYSGAEAKNDPRIEQSFRLGKSLVRWLDKWRNSIA